MLKQLTRSGDDLESSSSHSTAFCYTGDDRMITGSYLWRSSNTLKYFILTLNIVKYFTIFIVCRTHYRPTVDITRDITVILDIPLKSSFYFHHIFSRVNKRLSKYFFVKTGAYSPLVCAPALKWREITWVDLCYHGYRHRPEIKIF